ncbi:class I adenylate-forming enzyme family protein [Cyanobium sp. Morenito 9A2]|uniref:class I adenylate-forming enzyme family protein n=1 Tax=Cyanobium sp. Morenito 9A2 TaxID=2823718 RepID=UPI0020CE973D|nr:class I adenylate-forming enzyme family protein [Cyanobium sp. Morenito 9A2]MCP9848310.1 acyl--CoA ligase [Cyanobium sp. Morenito 9A2]
MPLLGPPAPSPHPLDQLLDLGLASAADQPALISADAQLSWRELDGRATELARRYRALGLLSGDRVASLLPNRLDAFLHLIACLRAGLVATPLNYRYRAPEIDHALTVSGARWLLFHRERQEDVDHCERLGDLDLGLFSYDDAVDGRLDQQLPSPGAAEPGATTLAPQAPALIFFTSGSTGPPKGVTHSRASLSALLNTYARNFVCSAADRFLIGSSVAHIAGLVGGLSGLNLGSQVIVARSTDSAELALLLERLRPTLLKLLPSALFALVRDPAVPADAFTSLRGCIASGDHIPHELHEELQARAGLPILELYAMTEAGILAANPPGREPRRGSVGPAALGVELELRDDDGRPVPAGTPGDLWVRTAASMGGYWGNPEATAEVLSEGWLATGDELRADTDGFLWFVGRRKQLIIHDSSNISPQEVEDALLDHPAVAQAGVVGVHDLVHGEIVRGYVVMRTQASGSPPSAAALIAFARKRVGYKAPEQIVVLETMPLNASGKVDRLALKALAGNAGEEPRQPGSPRR